MPVESSMVTDSRFCPAASCIALPACAAGIALATPMASTAAVLAIRMLQVRRLTMPLLHWTNGLSPTDSLSPILASRASALVILKTVFGAPRAQGHCNQPDFPKSDGFLKQVHGLPILA